LHIPLLCCVRKHQPLYHIFKQIELGALRLLKFFEGLPIEKFGKSSAPWR
jgi:hypothetical protein